MEIVCMKNEIQMDLGKEKIFNTPYNKKENLLIKLLIKFTYQISRDQKAEWHTSFTLVRLQRNSLMYCGWEYKLAHSLWRVTWQYQDFKWECTLWPRNSTFEKWSDSIFRLVQKDKCATIYIGELYSIVKGWKQLVYIIKELVE